MLRGVFVDIAGKKFGKLTAVKFLGYGKWLCKCECGQETIASGGNLRCGITKSCGCLREETSRLRHTKHGNLTHHGKTPHLYTVWRGINAKCHSKNGKSYANFGGQGIEVCREWRTDYAAFHDWAIKSGYSDNKDDLRYTLIRKDKSQGFSPENCIWAKAGTFDLPKKYTENQTSNNKIRLADNDNAPDIVGEEWRPIAESAGKYEVSNYGRVRSVLFRNGVTTFSRKHVLSLIDNGNGYKYVSLMINKKRCNRYVHRLVAEAFLPNPDGFKVVDHIDSDKTNNNVHNLQWCTQATNVKKAIPIGATGKRYINLDGEKYRVAIAGKHCGSYKTLDEAVSRRDELLSGEYSEYRLSGEEADE